MFNNPYMTNYQPNFTQQSLSDRIDGQIAQLQQMKEQMKNTQQPVINQTLQLAPTHQSSIKYANSLEEVNKEIIYADTPFFSKDMSVVWIKDTQGNVKTYELNEIVPLDEKDIKIQYLEAQIEELRGMIKNEPRANNENDDTKQNATNTSTNDGSNGTTIEESESTSVQKVSRSKAK